MPDRNRWDAINLPLRGGSQSLLSFYTYWFRGTDRILRQLRIEAKHYPTDCSSTFTKTLCLRLLTSRFIPPVDSIYIPFPRGRALKRVKSRHRRNIIIFDFLEIDSSAWRKKKNIALKGIETIIEGCVHVKEEERGRVLWDEQIMKRGANWEATIEPLKNDGRWLSSGAFVAAERRTF